MFKVMSQRIIPYPHNTTLIASFDTYDEARSFAIAANSKPFTPF